MQSMPSFNSHYNRQESDALLRMVTLGAGVRGVTLFVWRTLYDVTLYDVTHPLGRETLYQNYVQK